jgi:hypothetical protein
MSTRWFFIGFAVILCVTNATAVPVTWYLQGVTLADGGTASGSFVYDADNPLPNGTYSNISITTTAGTTVTANGYAFTDPGATSSSIHIYPVTAAGSLTGTPILILNFSSALTDAGGTVPIITTGAFTSLWAVCGDSTCNFAVAPFIDVTAGVVTTIPPGAASYYFTSYYSANAAAAPDASLRVINDGGQNGALWASIYVFDDSEELTQCCSCVVTPDGLLSESVKLNLTANPIRGIVNSRGVIKVISSSTESDVTTHFAANTPALGLKVWMTHIQGTKVTLSPGNQVIPVVANPYFVTETEAAHSNLSAGEQTLLQNLCMYDAMLSGKPCTCQPEDDDF